MPRSYHCFSALLFAMTSAILSREVSPIHPLKSEIAFQRTCSDVTIGSCHISLAQQRKHYRLRQLIQSTGNLDLAVRYGVPRSTAHGWLKHAKTNISSLSVLDRNADALQRAVLAFCRRVARLMSLPKRLLAQTEVRCSHSLIESWYRVIRHQWLYLSTLGAVASVWKLVAFCVDQHSCHLSHSAFSGQTPDEMYHRTEGIFQQSWKPLELPTDNHD